jgi:hypothetical protein
MKGSLLLPSLIFGITICANRVAGQQISGVTLTPPSPFPFSTFNVQVDGFFGATNYHFPNPPQPYFTLNRTGNDIALDLLIQTEPIGNPVVVPFSRTLIFDPLPPGSYNLTVRTLVAAPTPGDTEVVHFTVIPEPMTLSGMLAGAVLLRRQRRSAA